MVKGTMNHPKVSIITPTYNHENFIGQCIESVLAQTYPHWEQIIIDDGSTDRTGDIVAQYKDERIKYVRQNHLGIWKLGETYNKALQYAQGEFIAILEGDDFWPPFKLEKQIPAFERREVVLSWGKAAVTNSQGETIEIIPKNLKWIKNRTKEETLRGLLLENFPQSSTVMCRKRALLRIGGFKQPEGVHCIDTPTWLELSLIGDSRPVDEILGYHRQHAQQVTKMMFPKPAELHKYKIDFFKRLPQDLRNSIHVEAADLCRQVEHKISVAHFHKGRIALLKGQWEEAKKNFKQSLNKGSLRIKLESLLGLTCAYLRVDLEWAATITRRPRLK